MAINNKGFICGSNIIQGSIPADRLNKDSLVEIIRDILKEGSRETWLKEVFELVLKDSLKSEWTKEFFKGMLLECSKEEWFIDIFKEVGYSGIFEIIPSDHIFPAEGGKSTMQIIVPDETEWEVVL